MKKLVLLAAILALTACAGSDDSDTAKKDAEAEKKADAKEYRPNDLICPQVAILREVEAVAHEGTRTRMKNVSGDCAYKDNGVDIQFTLDIVASAGSGMTKPRYSLPYFVAIVDPQDNVLSRKTVTDSFDLSKDKTAETSDPLHVFIPLTKDEILSGPDYRVLVGFEKPGK